MLHRILACGLIAGLAAGLLAGGFAWLLGEPSVDAAIAYESGHAHSDALVATADRAPAVMPDSGGHSGDHADGSAVSRDVQRGPGLLLATSLFGLALGGVFAIACVVALRRAPEGRWRGLVAGLACGAFVVVSLVPFLKYPPNPPGASLAGTVDQRTALYWGMVVFSIAAAVLALWVRGALAPRVSAAWARVAAAVVYVGAMLAVALPLPALNEVPTDFPAVTLWEFREATIGTYLVLWAGIGIFFWLLVRRVVGPVPSRAPASLPPVAADAEGGR